MFNYEEGKRKLPSSNNLKNAFGSSSHNNLMSTLDKKRSDLSKDKYITRHLESGTIICQKSMIQLTPKEALSSILDRLKIIKTTKIIKLQTKSANNFFKQNLSKNLRWLSHN